MDGNARWAKKKGISKQQGYQKGLNKIKDLIDIFIENKIKYLTIFALSSENIKRIGVHIIFDIMIKNVDIFLEDIAKNNKVRIKIIGKKNNLPKKINNIIEKIEKITKKNNSLNLNVALNYGSKNELIDCFNNLINKNKNKGIKIDEKIIRENLYLTNIPDPDLLIRTGGYQRLSNFLLFQLSYTELFFTNTLWPEITKKEILNFFEQYKIIERKYGL